MTFDAVGVWSDFRLFIKNLPQHTVGVANETFYGTPTLKDLEMSLKGWSRF